MEVGDASLPPATDVGRVALTVDDRDRLTEFYEGILGLATLDRRRDSTVLGIAGEPCLVLSERPNLPARGPGETGLFHAAIRLPTRAAQHPRLRALSGSTLDACGESFYAIHCNSGA